MRGSRSSRLLVTALAIAFGCMMVPITANAEITSDELRPFVNSDGTLSSSMAGYFSSGEGAGGEALPLVILHITIRLIKKIQSKMPWVLQQTLRMCRVNCGT